MLSSLDGAPHAKARSRQPHVSSAVVATTWTDGVLKSYETKARPPPWPYWFAEPLPDPFSGCLQKQRWPMVRRWSSAFSQWTSAWRTPFELGSRGPVSSRWIPAQGSERSTTSCNIIAREREHQNLLRCRRSPRNSRGDCRLDDRDVGPRKTPTGRTCVKDARHGTNEYLSRSQWPSHVSGRPARDAKKNHRNATSSLSSLLLFGRSRR